MRPSRILFFAALVLILPAVSHAQARSYARRQGARAEIGGPRGAFAPEAGRFAPRGFRPGGPAMGSRGRFGGRFGGRQFGGERFDGRRGAPFGARFGAGFGARFGTGFGARFGARPRFLMRMQFGGGARRACGGRGPNWNVAHRHGRFRDC